MAFDITKALGDISRKPDGQKQIQYIPLHLIDTNPKNKYSTNGIESLAANIQMFGLLDPLIVKETPERRYMLISGHRRRLALRMNAEAAENYPDSMHEPVPCIVEPEDAPMPGIEDPEKAAAARPLAEELKLIYANADTRVMSSADTAQQVRRIRELFTGLQDLGYQFPGKMRDHVAAAAKVSATRVARLDVIEKNLFPEELRKSWKAGILQETSAYEIARRSPAVQMLVLQRVGVRPLQGMTTQQVTNCLEACEADGNRDREAREDWNKNVGAMAEAAGSSGAFNAEEYLAERAAEDGAFAEMLDYWADMFFQNLDWIQSRQEGIETLKKRFRNSGHYGSEVNYDGSSKGLTLYKERGRKILRTWTDVYDMLCLDALFRVAQIPEVSRADAVTQWQTGNPKEIGEYVVVYGPGTAETDATRSVRCMRWNGEEWINPKTNVRNIEGLTVYRWVKL